MAINAPSIFKVTSNIFTTLEVKKFIITNYSYRGNTINEEETEYEANLNDFLLSLCACFKESSDLGEGTYSKYYFEGVEGTVYQKRDNLLAGVIYSASHAGRIDFDTISDPRVIEKLFEIFSFEELTTARLFTAQTATWFGVIALNAFSDDAFGKLLRLTTSRDKDPISTSSYRELEASKKNVLANWGFNSNDTNAADTLLMVISVMSGSQFQSSSNSWATGLSALQISVMSAAALAECGYFLSWLTNNQLTYFNQTQLRSLNADQWNNLSDAQFTVLLDYANNSLLSSIVSPIAQGLSVSKVAIFSSWWADHQYATPIDVINGFSAAQASQLSIRGLLSVASVDQIKTELIGAMNGGQFAALGQIWLQKLTAQQIGVISSSAISSMDRAILSFAESQLAALNRKQLHAITSAQWEILTAAQVLSLPLSMYMSWTSGGLVDANEVPYDDEHKTILIDFDYFLKELVYHENIASRPDWSWSVFYTTPFIPDEFIDTSRTRIDTTGALEKRMLEVFRTDYLSIQGETLNSLVSTFGLHQLYSDDFLSPEAVGWLSASQLNGLSESNFNSLLDAANHINTLKTDLSVLAVHGLEQAKVVAAVDWWRNHETVIPVSVLNAFSREQVGWFDSKVFTSLGNFVDLISTAIVSGMTRQQFSAQSTEWLQKLTVRQVSLIDSKLFGGSYIHSYNAGLAFRVNNFSESQLAYLNSNQISAIVLNQWINLSDRQKKAILDIGGGSLSAVILNNLTKPQLLAFSDYQFEIIGTAVLKDLSANVVSSFASNLIWTLAVDQLKALSEPAKAQLSLQTVAGLTTSQYYALTGYNAGNKTYSTLLQYRCIALMSELQIAQLSPAQLSALPPNAFSEITDAQLKKLTRAQALNLDASQVLALTENQLKNLVIHPVVGMSDKAFSTLTVLDIQGLLLTTIESMNASGLSGASATQIQALSIDQVKKILPLVLAQLTLKDIAKFSTGQLTNLTDEQLTGIKNNTVARFDSVLSLGWSTQQKDILKLKDTIKVAPPSVLQTANRNYYSVSTLTRALFGMVIHKIRYDDNWSHKSILMTAEMRRRSSAEEIGRIERTNRTIATAQNIKTRIDAARQIGQTSRLFSTVQAGLVASEYFYAAEVAGASKERDLDIIKGVAAIASGAQVPFAILAAVVYEYAKLRDAAYATANPEIWKDTKAGVIVREKAYKNVASSSDEFKSILWKNFVESYKEKFLNANNYNEAFSVARKVMRNNYQILVNYDLASLADSILKAILNSNDYFIITDRADADTRINFKEHCSTALSTESIAYGYASDRTVNDGKLYDNSLLRKFDRNGIASDTKSLSDEIFDKSVRDFYNSGTDESKKVLEDLMKESPALEREINKKVGRVVDRVGRPNKVSAALVLEKTGFFGKTGFFTTLGMPIYNAYDAIRESAAPKRLSDLSEIIPGLKTKGNFFIDVGHPTTITFSESALVALNILGEMARGKASPGVFERLATGGAIFFFANIMGVGSAVVGLAFADKKDGAAIAFGTLNLTGSTAVLISDLLDVIAGARSVQTELGTISQAQRVSQAAGKILGVGLVMMMVATSGKQIHDATVAYQKDPSEGRLIAAIGTGLAAGAMLGSALVAMLVASTAGGPVAMIAAIVVTLLLPNFDAIGQWKDLDRKHDQLKKAGRSVEAHVIQFLKDLASKNSIPIYNWASTQHYKDAMRDIHSYMTEENYLLALTEGFASVIVDDSNNTTRKDDFATGLVQGFKDQIFETNKKAAEQKDSIDGIRYIVGQVAHSEQYWMTNRGFGGNSTEDRTSNYINSVFVGGDGNIGSKTSVDRYKVQSTNTMWAKDTIFINITDTTKKQVIEINATADFYGSIDVDASGSTADLTFLIMTGVKVNIKVGKGTNYVTAYSSSTNARQTDNFFITANADSGRVIVNYITNPDITLTQSILLDHVAPGAVTIGSNRANKVIGTASGQVYMYNSGVDDINMTGGHAEVTVGGRGATVVLGGGDNALNARLGYDVNAGFVVARFDGGEAALATYIWLSGDKKGQKFRSKIGRYENSDEKFSLDDTLKIATVSSGENKISFASSVSGLEIAIDGLKSESSVKTYSGNVKDEATFKNFTSITGSSQGDNVTVKNNTVFNEIHLGMGANDLSVTDSKDLAVYYAGPLLTNIYARNSSIFVTSMSGTGSVYLAGSSSVLASLSGVSDTIDSTDGTANFVHATTSVGNHLFKLDSSTSAVITVDPLSTNNLTRIVEKSGAGRALPTADGSGNLVNSGSAVSVYLGAAMLNEAVGVDVDGAFVHFVTTDGTGSELTYGFTNGSLVWDDQTKTGADNANFVFLDYKYEWAGAVISVSAVVRQLKDMLARRYSMSKTVEGVRFVSLADVIDQVLLTTGADVTGDVNNSDLTGGKVVRHSVGSFSVNGSRNDVYIKGDTGSVVSVYGTDVALHGLYGTNAAKLVNNGTKVSVIGAGAAVSMLASNQELYLESGDAKVSAVSEGLTGMLIKDNGGGSDIAVGNLFSGSIESSRGGTKVNMSAGLTSSVTLTGKDFVVSTSGAGSTVKLTRDSSAIISGSKTQIGIVGSNTSVELSGAKDTVNVAAFTTGVTIRDTAGKGIVNVGQRFSGSVYGKNTTVNFTENAFSVPASNDQPSFASNETSRLVFNGNNQYVGVADAGISDEITVEAWVNASDPTRSWQRVFDLGNGPLADNILLAFEGTSGRPVLYNFDADKRGKRITASSALGRGWRHVAATISSNGLGKVYIDGVLAVSGDVGLVSATQRLNNFIGKSNWSSDAMFLGEMRDIRVWSTERTEAQIKANMGTSISSAPESAKAGGLRIWIPVIAEGPAVNMVGTESIAVHGVDIAVNGLSGARVVSGVVPAGATVEVYDSGSSVKVDDAAAIVLHDNDQTIEIDNSGVYVTSVVDNKSEHIIADGAVIDFSNRLGNKADVSGFGNVIKGDVGSEFWVYGEGNSINGAAVAAKSHVRVEQDRSLVTDYFTEFVAAPGTSSAKTAVLAQKSASWLASYANVVSNSTYTVQVSNAVIRMKSNIVKTTIVDNYGNATINVTSGFSGVVRSQYGSTRINMLSGKESYVVLYGRDFNITQGSNVGHFDLTQGSSATTSASDHYIGIVGSNSTLTLNGAGNSVGMLENLTNVVIKDNGGSATIGTGNGFNGTVYGMNTMLNLAGNGGVYSKINGSNITVNGLRGGPGNGAWVDLIDEGTTATTNGTGYVYLYGKKQQLTLNGAGSLVTVASAGLTDMRILDNGGNSTVNAASGFTGSIQGNGTTVNLSGGREFAALSGVNMVVNGLAGNWGSGAWVDLHSAGSSLTAYGAGVVDLFDKNQTLILKSAGSTVNISSTDLTGMSISDNGGGSTVNASSGFNGSVSGSNGTTVNLSNNNGFAKLSGTNIIAKGLAGGVGNAWVDLLGAGSSLTTYGTGFVGMYDKNQTVTLTGAGSMVSAIGDSLTGMTINDNGGRSTVNTAKYFNGSVCSSGGNTIVNMVAGSESYLALSGSNFNVEMGKDSGHFDVTSYSSATTAASSHYIGIIGSNSTLTLNGASNTIGMRENMTNVAIYDYGGGATVYANNGFGGVVYGKNTILKFASVGSAYSRITGSNITVTGLRGSVKTGAWVGLTGDGTSAVVSGSGCSILYGNNQVVTANDTGASIVGRAENITAHIFSNSSNIDFKKSHNTKVDVTGLRNILTGGTGAQFWVYGAGNKVNGVDVESFRHVTVQSNGSLLTQALGSFVPAAGTLAADIPMLEKKMGYFMLANQK